MEKFGDRRYILVSALVHGNSSIKDDGNYRFLYPYQEIPLAILKGEPYTEPEYPIDRIPEPYKPTDKNHNHEHSSTGGGLLKILAITVILAFLVFAGYKCCIKRCMKRRRRQRMAEQGMGEVRYQEFASYTS